MLPLGNNDISECAEDMFSAHSCLAFTFAFAMHLESIVANGAIHTQR